MDLPSNVRYNSDTCIQIHLPFTRLDFHVISNPIHWCIAAHFPDIWSRKIFCQFCYPVKVHIFSNGLIFKDKTQNLSSLCHILGQSTIYNASRTVQEDPFSKPYTIILSIFNLWGQFNWRHMFCYKCLCSDMNNITATILKLTEPLLKQGWTGCMENLYNSEASTKILEVIHKGNCVSAWKQNRKKCSKHCER